MMSVLDRTQSVNVIRIFIESNIANCGMSSPIWKKALIRANTLLHIAFTWFNQKFVLICRLYDLSTYSTITVSLHFYRTKIDIIEYNYIFIRSCILNLKIKLYVWGSTLALILLTIKKIKLGYFITNHTRKITHWNQQN